MKGKIYNMEKNFILKIAMVSIVIIGMFSSCMPDEGTEEPQKWYSFGTYQQSNSNYPFTILLDNGQELLPLNGSGFNLDYTLNTRVLVYYTISSQTTEEVIANISDIGPVLTQDIIQLTEEIKDSIGLDGVFLDTRNIWLSPSHLNITFSYYGGGGPHTVNLVKPIGDQLDEDGNQILEFKHNANGDTYTDVLTSIAAFSFDSLYVEGMDTLNFVLRAYDYDSVLTEVGGEYYFDGTNLLEREAVNTKREYTRLSEGGF